MCNNLYCSPVLPKPDWFSEKTWNILNRENISEQLMFDKGVLIIKDVKEENQYILQKLINIKEEFDKFSIPLSLEIGENTNLRIDIILTKEPIDNNIPNTSSIFNATIIQKNNSIYFSNDYNPIKSKYQFSNGDKYYMEYIFDNKEYDNMLILNRIYQNSESIIETENYFEKSDFISKFYINIQIRISDLSGDNYIKMQID